MSAYSQPPEDARPPPSRPGSRLETLVLVSKLVCDLVSVPFHFVAFLLTRGAHRRRFRDALRDTSVERTSTR